MEKIERFLLPFLFLTGSLYLFMVFVELAWDPRRWGEPARVVFGVFTVIFLWASFGWAIED
jgi:hypothetical protein